MRLPAFHEAEIEAQEGVTHPQSHHRTEALPLVQNGFLSPPQTCDVKDLRTGTSPRRWPCTSHPPSTPTIRHHPSFLFKFATTSCGTPGNFLLPLGCM